MTAAWVDDLGAGDAPVCCVLTRDGHVASWLRYTTLTATEASRLLNIGSATVTQHARSGRLPGVQVDGLWLFDLADVLALCESLPASQWRPARLDAGPLLRQVALRGGDYACGVRVGSAEKRALERARAEGTLTVYAADQLASRVLRVTAWEVWGDDYLTA